MVSGTIPTTGRIGVLSRTAGSSRGRGPRTAGWFADYLADKQGHSLKCWVLEGGIKGWVKAGPEYTEWMDGYEPTAWENIEEH